MHVLLCYSSTQAYVHVLSCYSSTQAYVHVLSIDLRMTVPILFSPPLPLNCHAHKWLAAYLMASILKLRGQCSSFSSQLAPCTYGNHHLTEGGGGMEKGSELPHRQVPLSEGY